MIKTYKDENDNELLYLVSENNEEANKLFFDKYDNIIRMKASKYKKFVESKGFDYNDLLQEGRLGLTEAINCFKEQKNVKFYTFANLCINRQITSFLRNITREKHEILNGSLSLDSTTNSIGRPITDLILDDKNINPENSFINIEEEQELLNKIEQKLTESEKEVFYLRLEGFTYKEIALLLNITIKAVDGKMSKIKAKREKIMKK